MAGEEAIIIHMIQKKIIRKFRDQCATDPRQATTLESLGVKNRKIAKCLIRKKVLVGVGDDRFYLDEDAAEQFFKKKRRAAYAVLIIAIIAALIAILITK
ncbi:MAG: hypothetical protein NTW38_00460 [Candidatus Aminicenantes bacterium]|nr:hypothetical protein [Candidatus Aminicenantes bacterium]